MLNRNILLNSGSKFIKNFKSALMDSLSSFPWLYQGCHKAFICHLSLGFFVLTISENNSLLITLTVFRSIENIVCREPLVGWD